MQKLLEELKNNTPTSASQACSSVSMSLNKEETLSVTSKTLSNNISEENQQSGKTGQDLRVSVLNMRGEPLMPTTPGKARHLLEQKKAKVISRKPFTIQLNHQTGETKQSIKLGIDAGYKTIGFSAISNKQELMSGEVILRENVSKLLAERAMYRRQKRSKLWYRPARFLNRKKNEDWLAPSIQHKLDSHIRLVEKIKKLLPISEVIVEVAKFDIQKIENPNIAEEQYQQGTLYEYRNRIAYLVAREKGLCQFCNKEYMKGNPWRLHHIYGKERDRPEDWALLHEACHDEIHKKHLEETLKGKPSKSYKDATLMNTIRWKLVDTLGCKYTYGNITFQDRIDLKLEKSHINDAFVIAGGTSQKRCKSFLVKQVRRNNRCLQCNRKGFKPSIRRKHYGLQPYDIVAYDGKEYYSKGVHCKGTYIRIFNSLETLDINIKKIKLICYGKGLQFLPWSLKATL
ncbi:MAG: RRXRR domain-containing protein [Thermoplasmata archaeon]|nr:RRXRR domain-containing protein [Thermoplasmata archaeon]MBE3140582.1 RRXRR domain-containing protein [Thermoplasmata archaeon]